MSADKADHTDAPAVEITAGLFFVVLAIALLFWVIPVNVGSSTSEHDMSPDLFPRLAAWSLLGLSLSLVVNRLVKTADIRQAFTSYTGGSTIILEAFLWLIVGVFAYIGMASLSFYATGCGLVVIGAIACHYNNRWILAGLALLLPFVLMQVSWLIFEVKLP